MTQATRRPARASSAHSLDFFGFCSMRTASEGSSTWRSPDWRKRRTPRPPEKSFSKATRMTPAAGSSFASGLSSSAMLGKGPEVLGGLSRARGAAAAIVRVAVAIASRKAVDQLDQLLGAEGLRDVCVKACFERAQPVLVGGEGRHGDARDGARPLVGAHFAQKAPAVERGHREV